jgi:hypothetical protein
MAQYGMLIIPIEWVCCDYARHLTVEISSQGSRWRNPAADRWMEPSQKCAKETLSTIWPRISTNK